MARRDFFAIKLDTDPAEQGFQPRLENPLRATTHAPPAVAGIIRRKNDSSFQPGCVRSLEFLFHNIWSRKRRGVGPISALAQRNTLSCPHRLRLRTIVPTLVAVAGSSGLRNIRPAPPRKP